MLLKYLFPVAEINYFVLEKYFTKIKKYGLVLKI